MKKMIVWILGLSLLFGCAAAETTVETKIVLSDGAITVNGAAITEDETAAVYLDYVIETHEDVPEDLKDLENRVVTIAEGGVYRISGTATDAQIAVKAGEEDKIRLILDGVEISCRTNAAIGVYSAADPRTAGEYGVAIELAEGSENIVTGSHNSAESDDEIEFDGAISAAVSIGFEGSGSLIINGDKEGVEVSCGHMTINGGVFHIEAGDDPLNVSEDGFGVLTMNDGYVFSSVRPDAGGEGDGIDSNGQIVFNGGTAINLAHPTSQDGGIDSDMGSFINGGVIVGAGNMYDPIEADSDQLFMMLEFGEATNDLVVVTDENDNPVFAYDFPYDYMYIAFSTPQLKEGTYHVYLGGEIEGEQTDGLYTSISSYTPGARMQHGEGNAQQRGMGFGGAAPDMPDGMQMPKGADGMGFGGQFGGRNDFAAFSGIDLNEILAGADLNELLEGKDLNGLLTGFQITDLLSEEEIQEYLGDIDLSAMQVPQDMGNMPFGGMGGGMGGGMRGMQSSADVATADFELSAENTGFSNVRAAQ